MWLPRQALAKIHFHLASSCSHLWYSCPSAVCNHAMAGQEPAGGSTLDTPSFSSAWSLTALLKLSPAAAQTYPWTLSWGISGWPFCSSDAVLGATKSPRKAPVKTWRELVLTSSTAFQGHAGRVCGIMGSDHRTFCAACGTVMLLLPELWHQFWYTASCLASRMPPSIGFLISELSRWLEIMYEQ